MLLTYGALERMALRDNDVKAYTFVGKFMDEVYPDDFLYDKFPIMSPKK